jgi:hypothetical protein
MPHVASNEQDQAAITLLRDWVQSLSDEKQLERPGAIRAKRN